MLGALIGGIASLAGGLFGARSQRKAAQQASQSQENMSREAIAEQRRQFDTTRQLLQPYVQAGDQGLAQYADLLGLNGENAQSQAIFGIENSPFFKSQYRQAENAILQNASATGGLRGGNTQSALADNRMNMLFQNVQNHQQQLANLATMGQNSSAGVGNMGMAMAGNIGNQLNGIGSAQAGYALARGQANQNIMNGVLGGVGLLGKYKGWW